MNNDTIITGTEKADYIVGSGDDVIVNIKNDKIILEGAFTLDNLDIIGGEGVLLENLSANSLVSGTSDNDSITNYGNNVTVQALGGMDTVANMSTNSIIDAGDGSDSISNYSPTGILSVFTLLK